MPNFISINCEVSKSMVPSNQKLIQGGEGGGGGVLYICIFIVITTVSSYYRSIIENPYWTSKKNSLELTELSSVNKVILV